MERRAKLRIARWAGPVLGSLLMSGCGAGDGPAPTGQSTPTLTVEMPQVQEFGAARPLGDEDYRSRGFVPGQTPAPGWGAPAVESGPVASMPPTMPGVPWISSPMANGESVVPDSVSIDEYLANRANAPAPVEPDSVSVEDYMALRARLQQEPVPAKNPVTETNPGDYNPPASGFESVPESSPMVDRYAKPELPDFPSTAPPLASARVPEHFQKPELPDFPSTVPVETSPNVAVDSVPGSQPVISQRRAEDPAIYTPTANATPPSDQEPTTQRLPETPTSPVVEVPISTQLQASAAPQLNGAPVQERTAPIRSASTSRTVRTPPRSPEMTGVVRDAERHNGRGFDLATRGALMAARREFIEGLRIIALQLDKDGDTRHFTRALACGLAALDEADDFSTRGSRLEVELDLPLLVRGHRTPVLKGVDVKDLSPLVAAGRYYTYAQEQLGMVAGGEMSGSLALYGLGKVHDMINEQRLPQFNAPLPKAMVYHQAALTTDPRNFRAANDLGVLLARAGRLEISKAMLEHSLRVTSQPAVWRNLAVVHDELGETQLSARARQLAVASQAEGSKAFPPGANPNTSRFAVQWVDPATFAASSRAASDIQPTQANSPAALSNLPPTAKAPKAASSWSPMGSFPAATAQPVSGPKGLFTR